MHFPVLIIRHRILLQLFRHRIIINYPGTAVTYQFHDIEQFAGIASAIAQQRFCFLDLQSQIPDVLVFGQHPVH